MKKLIGTLIIVLITASTLFGQSEKIVPTFKEVLSLQSPGSPIISPDGNQLVYTVSQVDWEDNRFDTEIWISKKGMKPFQLTNNPEGNSSQPQWSPDGEWISFTSSRGEKNQIFVMRHIGGEAFQVSNVKQGVGSYKWSPDGKSIAFTIQSENEELTKKREELYGKYSVEDNEYKQTRLHLLKFNPDLLGIFEKFGETEQLIDSVDFTIGSYSGRRMNLILHLLINQIH